ncbi:hypothetical protein [Paracoccus sp. TOH]|uniref:Uncharacterized protein n=1 Tax=Paracoccus simplex TaxID=2086346 RepID=A0ABV7RV61_9RHOB|nr:hypothetical protein [Paracoccus sp. TOH]WJS83702.1 hypothetical protein NBE95_07930 [Paracoccus sp. TOH]
MNEFESLGLKGGIWQGVLQRPTPPARLVLVHMGARVAEARVSPDAAGGWRVAAPIPAERLSDGVQSFLLLEDQGEEGEPPRPGALHLGSLTLVAGALLDDDLRAELELMRAELELLKKELRRLAARTEAG